VDRTRAVGVPVSVTVDGPVTGLPVAVDLAAYRIVQEALTNVLRHAGTATATVRVAVTEEAVAVEVTDTGRGGPVAPGGHGLAGMRERVTALGGELSAGPAPAGGFAVSATIPRPPASSRQPSPAPPPASTGAPNPTRTATAAPTAPTPAPASNPTPASLTPASNPTSAVAPAPPADPASVAEPRTSAPSSVEHHDA
jgi:hypothetical protein